MSIKKLQDLGVFVPLKTETITVKWKDYSGAKPVDVSVEVDIRKPSVAAINRAVHEANKEADGGFVDSTVCYIVASVVDEEGHPLFTYDLASSLDSVFANALYMAIIAHHGKPRDPKPEITPEEEFWCEVALGIGGRTIEELQAVMSNDEALIWASYIEKNGTLNIGMRIDAGAALGAFMSGKTVKKNAKITDFLPRRGTAKAKQQSNDEMLSVFMKMAEAKKQNGG